VNCNILLIKEEEEEKLKDDRTKTFPLYLGERGGFLPIKKTTQICMIMKSVDNY